MSRTLDYIQWFSCLKPEDLENIGDYYCSEIYFKDPFNEFTGIERLTRIFEHMFKSLDHPRFEILEVISQEEASFLTWNFIFSLKNREYIIHGSSHVKFNSDNLVVYHRDYWDVGEEVFLKIPFFRTMYKIFSNKLKVK